MRIVYVAVLLTTLATGVTAACEHATRLSDESSDKAQPFITREWSWSDGISTTTFTAYGPPQQVNRLDPENGIIQCPDCELTSSVQFGPVSEASQDEQDG